MRGGAGANTPSAAGGGRGGGLLTGVPLSHQAGPAPALPPPLSPHQAGSVAALPPFCSALTLPPPFSHQAGPAAALPPAPAAAVQRCRRDAAPRDGAAGPAHRHVPGRGGSLYRRAPEPGDAAAPEPAAGAVQPRGQRGMGARGTRKGNSRGIGGKNEGRGVIGGHCLPAQRPSSQPFQQLLPHLLQVVCPSDDTALGKPIVAVLQGNLRTCTYTLTG